MSWWEAQGLDDYALIEDFTVGSDLLEVVGSANNYTFASSPNGLPDGTGVFFEQAGETNELIAILEGTSSDTLDPADVFGLAGEIELSDEQTEIAQFWSFDRTDTFRPPGHWNLIAQEILLQSQAVGRSD